MHYAYRLQGRITLIFFGVLTLGLALLMSVSIGAQARTEHTFHTTFGQNSRANWPMYGYDSQHTSFNPNETSIGISNVSKLVPAWTRSASYSLYTSPVVVNNTIYFASVYDLYALNAMTGKTIWTFHPSHPNNFITTPIVANGILYIGTDNDGIQAFDAATGKVLWSAPVGSLGDTDPVLYKGIIYLGSNSYVYAINAGTGKTVWSVNANSTIYDSASVANGIVYIGAGGNLIAYNALTGAKHWSYMTRTNILSSPVISKGVVYFSSDTSTYALNAQTGKEVWNTANQPQSNATSLAVANGVVYAETGTIDAFDAVTGKLLWNAATGIDVYPPSSPDIAVANGVLYAGSFESPRQASVYAFDATTGKQLWSYFVASNAEAYKLVIVNGMLYIGINSVIYAFHLG